MGPNSLTGERDQNAMSVRTAIPTEEGKEGRKGREGKGKERKGYP